ncbi:MAG: PAS domain S-box protein, partial [Nitrospinota bacterium]
MLNHASQSSSFPLSQQLQIDIQERQKRKAFLCLSPDDARVLQSLRPLIEKHLDTIVNDFYHHLLQFEDTRQFLADPELLSRLQQLQKDSLLSLTSGQYDAQHFEERLRVGYAHARLHILPHWYIGAYSLFSQMLTQRIIETWRDDPEKIEQALLALNKIIHLDMTLAIESYMYHYNRQLEEMNTALQEHARLLEEKVRERTAEITTRNKELEAINAIAWATTQKHDLNKVLQDTLEQIFRILSVDWGGIYLLQNEKLVLRTWKGEALPFLQKLQEIDLASQPWVYTTQVCPVWVWGKGRTLQDAGKTVGIQSWCSFPLKARQELIGLILLASRDPQGFPLIQTDLVNTLGQQLGIAIENTQLYTTLQESERNYREMVENSPHIIFRLNARGEMLFVNQTVTQLLGYKPKDFYQDYTLRKRITHPEDWKKFRLETVFQGKRVEDIEIRLRHKQTRRWLWFSLLAYPLRDEHGHVIAAEGVARDITEKKLMEEEMLRSEKLAVVGQLASGLAHEIGTPLGVISGTAELLMMETTDENSRHELKVIVSEAERITMLIQQLLTFARPHTGEMDRIDIHQCLERALRLLEYRFHKEHIRVVKLFQPDLPPVLGVSNQLEQVFLNFLVNAWHA